MKSQRAIIIWLFSGCLLIWAMVVLGGITHLTNSGLSMVNWSFMGSFPPLTHAQWQSAFNAYKATPQFKLVNSYFSLADFKSIYWPEYIHRTVGRLTGIVFIIPFLYFLIRKMVSRQLLGKLLVILAMGGLQGLLGWYMVKSGLVNRPDVSHYRLAAHLITAFLTFGFTFWVALDLIYPERAKNEQLKTLKRLSYALFFFLLLQIMYGAFVSGLHAGRFDPTWPKMGNNWIAPEVTSLSPWWQNFVDGVAGVQFVHRYNAYLVVLLVFLLWYKSRKLQLHTTQRKGINFLLGMVFLQFILGVLTLINSDPITLGVLHQTGAFLLFASTVFVIHQWEVAPAEKKVAA